MYLTFQDFNTCTTEWRSVLTMAQARDVPDDALLIQFALRLNQLRGVDDAPSLLHPEGKPWTRKPCILQFAQVERNTRNWYRAEHKLRESYGPGADLPKEQHGASLCLHREL